MATYVGSEGWLITITNTSFGNYGIQNPKYGNKNTLAMSEARLEPFKYHSFEKDEEPKKKDIWGSGYALICATYLCTMCDTCKPISALSSQISAKCRTLPRVSELCELL